LPDDALRRLTTIVFPGSDALVETRARLDEARNELRAAQSLQAGISDSAGRLVAAARKYLAAQTRVSLNVSEAVSGLSANAKEAEAAKKHLAELLERAEQIHPNTLGDVAQGIALLSRGDPALVEKLREAYSKTESVQHKASILVSFSRIKDHLLALTRFREALDSQHSLLRIHALHGALCLAMDESASAAARSAAKNFLVEAAKHSDQKVSRRAAESVKDLEEFGN